MTWRRGGLRYGQISVADHLEYFSQGIGTWGTFQALDASQSIVRNPPMYEIHLSEWTL